MFDDLKAALLSATNITYHYEAPTGTKAPYIIWAEDGGADTVWADGEMQHQAITGTIDLFSKTENDALISAIQAALTLKGISYRLESVQRETDTKLIHHEWRFEVM